MFHDELTSNYPLTCIKYFAIKDESNHKNMYCYKSQKCMCRKRLRYLIFPQTHMSANTLLQRINFILILHLILFEIHVLPCGYMSDWFVLEMISYANKI